MVEKTAAVRETAPDDLLPEDEIEAAVALEEKERAETAARNVIPASQKPTGFIRPKSDVHFLPHGSKPDARKRMLTGGMIFESRMFAAVDVARLLVAGLIEYVEPPAPAPRLLQ